MKISKIELEYSSIKELAEFIKQNTIVDYSSICESSFTIGEEKYYLRNNSTQFNVYVARLYDDKIIVDILATAGGTGIFNFALFAESDFLVSGEKLIKKYADDNKLTYKVL